MELLSQAKQYMVPAAVSVMAISLLKIGLFVTHGDLEQSLRLLENSLRAEYATRRDIDDIKQLLGKMDSRLSRLDERLAGLQEEAWKEKNWSSERTLKNSASSGIRRGSDNER